MALTIDDAKAHLNVTFTDDDALITSKLAAAKAWVSDYTGGSVDNDGTPQPVR